MTFVDLTPADIVREWPERAEHFHKIAESMGGRFSVSDLITYVRDGKYNAHGLRVGERAPLTILTSTVDYPQKRALVINAVAGNGMRGWLREARDGVMDLAKRRGVDIIEAHGRKGWARLIPGSGSKGRVFLESEVF